MKNLFSIATLFALLLSSCGPSIYKTTDFQDVTKDHKTIAIIPATVMIQLRPNEAKKLTPEQIEKNEEATGYAMQEKMYGWFLRRSSKYHFTVNFQDVSETNALLQNAKLSYKDIMKKSKGELAKILGVDAVISASLHTDKPMNEGVAVALGLLVGYWGNTNKAYTTIDIHEGKKGNLLWKYDYEASGSVGSNPENLVNALMRNASKKFPYNAKS
ncbi:hypothetical protein OCK74_23380 [Chitinophagaceae bacterium LB-8]|uniref:Lipoprotein n=1 Tax=Paraflavisolibacter caeni TaxID=2982496 RepID=A0A9X3BA20_9BACT|nr:hypothetical protein [Paraflavisolibacter caeni]MCU7552081.1 hypothetical protein [Paraflavisolibacter caeni]